MDFIRPLGGRPSIFFSLSLSPFLLSFLFRPPYPAGDLRFHRPPSRSPSLIVFHSFLRPFHFVTVRVPGRALRDICGAARVGRIKSQEEQKKKKGQGKKREERAEEYLRSHRYTLVERVASEDNFTVYVKEGSGIAFSSVPELQEFCDHRYTKSIVQRIHANIRNCK